MANEKRLIDANLVDKRLAKDLESGDEKFSISWFRSWISVQETVDAVEVVRCKDCNQYNGHRYCTYFAETVLDGDFCSYGERKDNGTV